MQTVNPTLPFRTAQRGHCHFVSLQAHPTLLLSLIPMATSGWAQVHQQPSCMCWNPTHRRCDWNRMVRAVCPRRFGMLEETKPTFLCGMGPGELLYRLKFGQMQAMTVWSSTAIRTLASGCHRQPLRCTSVAPMALQACWLRTALLLPLRCARCSRCRTMEGRFSRWKTPTRAQSGFLYMKIQCPTGSLSLTGSMTGRK